jgi:glycosyltransferase involved in cell wall biosynthesis
MADFSITRPKVYVVVTCRNAEHEIPKMLQSLLDQVYTDFGCVIYDDASTDQTVQVLRSIIGEDPRFHVICGATRVWATEGRWVALNRIKNAPRNSLVVLLDGDDWLYDETVLDYLVSTYFKSRYLAGHGNFISDGGELCGWSQDYPEEIKQQGSYRIQPWVATHLRWFRLGLREHLPYSALLDTDGNPFKAATDFALFLPILELSGPQTVYCPQPLYVYNRRDGKVDERTWRKLQKEAENGIRGKQPLKPINVEMIL